MSMHLRSDVLVLAGVVVCSGALSFSNGETAKQNVISHPRVVDPKRLDLSAFPDYPAALDSEHRRGVTPANNAAVQFVRAFGPFFLPEQADSTVLAELGFPDLPEEGSYFLDFGHYHGSKPEVSAAFYKKIQLEYDAALSGPWRRRECPAVDEWLNAIKTPLQHVMAGTERTEYFIPLCGSPKLTQLPDPTDRIAACLPRLGVYPVVVRSLVIRALRQTDTENTDGAYRDLLAAHRVARLLSRGPTLLERLVAARCEKIASQGDCALVASGRVGPEEARKHQAAIQALPPLLSLVDSLDRAERDRGLGFIKLCATEGLQSIIGSKETDGIVPSGLGRVDVNWSIAFTLFTTWHDRLVSAARIADVSSRRQAAEALEREYESGIRSSLAADLPRLQRALAALPSGQAVNVGDEGSRIVAKLLLDMTRPHVGRSVDLYEEALQWCDLARITLALEASRGDHGRYPTRLQSLVPKYIQRLPQDRFSGRELIYRRIGDGHIVYSVGMNLRDDGGRCDAGTGGADDIVIRTGPQP